MNTPHAAPLVIVSGLSGAGKTTALKALEDIGYEAVDNLPLTLLESVAASRGDERQALAVGIDIRTRDLDIDHFNAMFDALAGRAELDLRVLFLDCDDEIIQRRFIETRRRHPLAADRPVIDGIRLEREVLGWLRARADRVIDTSRLAIADLKRLLSGDYLLDSSAGLAVFVTSFGFPLGLPRDADLVFDVRFLANPITTRACARSPASTPRSPALSWPTRPSHRFSIGSPTCSSSCSRLTNGRASRTSPSRSAAPAGVTVRCLRPSAWPFA